MTYLHALQYLSAEAAREGRAQVSSATYEAYRAALGASETRFQYLLFTADQRGLLCAAYCRAALLSAGIHVGEIADGSCGALSDVLRIDSQPVSPSALRELCHRARAIEQKLLRAAQAQALSTEGGEERTTPDSLDGARRCGAVLPRLFSEAGCRVILLIGRIRDPRLSHLAQASPSHTVAVIGGSEDAPLPVFPKGTAEVISPTCGSTRFRRITDACARAGSRLTLTATSHLQRRAATPFSQTFSYRTVRDCTLRCGAKEALREAMLATEVLLTLRRFGCEVSDTAIRDGVSSVALPTFLAPLSVRPPVIAHAVHDEDDLTVLLQALEEFDGALPRPYRFLCDPSLDAACHLQLSAQGELILTGAGTSAPRPDASDDGSDDATYVLLGKREPLVERISAWQRSVRRL